MVRNESFCGTLTDELYLEPRARERGRVNSIYRDNSQFVIVIWINISNQEREGLKSVFLKCLRLAQVLQTLCVPFGQWLCVSQSQVVWITCATQSANKWFSSTQAVRFAAWIYIASFQKLTWCLCCTEKPAFECGSCNLMFRFVELDSFFTEASAEPRCWTNIPRLQPLVSNATCLNEYIQQDHNNINITIWLQDALESDWNLDFVCLLNVCWFDSIVNQNCVCESVSGNLFMGDCMMTLCAESEGMPFSDSHEVLCFWPFVAG